MVGKTESHNSSSDEDESLEWMSPITDMLSMLKGRPVDLSIFKVPYTLRKVNESAYIPCSVSIGPFHASSDTRSYLQHKLANVPHDQQAAEEENNCEENMKSLQQKLAKKHDHLLDMEENKWWYMLFFLLKTKDPMKALRDFGVAIKKQESNVRLSYAERITLGSNELAEMMLVDGCFILELFIRFWFKDNGHEADLISWCGDQNPYNGDPIFHNSQMLPTLRRDLALLENQIPFSILQTLYREFMNHKKTCAQNIEIPSITQLALSYFRPDLKDLKPINQEDLEANQLNQGANDVKHLLHLLHKFYLPTACMPDNPAPAPAPAKSKETVGFREGATNLLGAGIVFVKGSEENLLDVVFNKHKGRIEIPPLSINETMESLLRNLIAFEQCNPRCGYHVASYVILMKSLLCTLPDVELLQTKKIITDNLGGTQNVLNFFTNISVGVVLEDYCFRKLCNDVYKYQYSWRHCHRITALCKVRCLGYMTTLKREYFSSPWSFISFIAAVILLGLTLAQTYYTVLSYEDPH